MLNEISEIRRSLQMVIQTLDRFESMKPAGNESAITPRISRVSVDLSRTEPVSLRVSRTEPESAMTPGSLPETDEKQIGASVGFPPETASSILEYENTY